MPTDRHVARLGLEPEGDDDLGEGAEQRDGTGQLGLPVRADQILQIAADRGRTLARTGEELIDPAQQDLAVFGQRAALVAVDDLVDDRLAEPLILRTGEADLRQYPQSVVRALRIRAISLVW